MGIIEDDPYTHVSEEDKANSKKWMEEILVCRHCGKPLLRNNHKECRPPINSSIDKRGVGGGL